MFTKSAVRSTNIIIEPDVKCLCQVEAVNGIPQVGYEGHTTC